MSWLTITEAARYAHMRRSRFEELVRRGFLQTYPSPAWRLGHEPARLIDTTDIDALIRGGAPQGPKRREVTISRMKG